MRFFLIAAAQMAALAVVFWFWRTVGPHVGLLGLGLWTGSCYALAWHWQRQANRDFLDEYERRFGKAPPGP